MYAPIDHWKYDVAFLEALNIQWNDKLSVHGGRLQLQKGSSFRTLGTPVASDPSIVASHLESLIKFIGTDCFNFLKKSADDTHLFYERIAQFKREVDCFATRASDLGGTFRSFDINDKISRERFTRIYYTAYVFLNEVKKYKATLTKPAPDQRPIKHILYDERTSLKSFRWRHSKRVPLHETVAAAKKALELTQPGQWESMALGAGDWVLANVLKSTPQLTDRYVQSSHHMQAYQFFSNQVLRLPVITEEMAQAFEELAPHAELLDLDKTTLASSSSAKELAPYIKEGDFPLSRFLEAVVAPQISLTDITHLYQTADEWHLDHEESLKKYCTEWQLVDQPSYTGRFISPAVLQRLLDTALKSATCRKIALSKSLVELPSVVEFLSKNKYVLSENVQYTKLYTR